MKGDGLQAVSLSNMDGKRLPHIDSQRGTSVPSLQPLVTWFRTGFRCLTLVEVAARKVQSLASHLLDPKSDPPAGSPDLSLLVAGSVRES